MAYRIGVDIGGTFTDVALLDEATGRMMTHKLLTTPADPSRAVIDGVKSVVNDNGVAIEAVADIVHGTTLVTNAIIERKGAVTAMIVTEGFRDVLDIAQERRYDLFDLRIAFPEPVVPRRLRLEVAERIAFDGEVLKPLRLEPLRRAFARLASRHPVASVAVCCLHSYVSPDHEEAIRAWLIRAFPDLYVSVSSEVLPYMREYERWTTTCLNAYVQPLVDQYLGRLATALTRLGFKGEFHVMSSSGGTLTQGMARRFPIRMLESGPAAGALVSAQHGRTMGISQVLSFDMGGTTAKGCIVRDGQPLKKYDFEVARIHEFKRGSGLPLKIPVIDMIEIGAGGGSIAEVDERGVLRVGPRSAGARPGPACYGRGGKEATLTDANLILGYLDAGSFLGGTMSLDRAASERAIVRHVATPLGVDAQRAAWGIHEVISEDVARAFRVHASERGVDYRRCSMIAFGGSGPLHALRIARKLKIPRVVCPLGAGVMSAFGLLTSPLAFELVRSRRLALDQIDAAVIADQFEALAREATRFLVEGGVAEDEVRILRRLDMRYEGQGYEVEVALPDDLGLDRVLDSLPQLFRRRYEQIFTTSFADRTVEIVNWKVEVVAPSRSDVDAFRMAGLRPSAAAVRGHRKAYDPDAGTFVDCPVYDRYALAPGARIEGPALIEEHESTSVVGGQDRVVVDARHNLIADIRTSP